MASCHSDEITPADINKTELILEMRSRVEGMYSVVVFTEDMFFQAEESQFYENFYAAIDTDKIITIVILSEFTEIRVPAYMLLDQKDIVLITTDIKKLVQFFDEHKNIV
ncbi:hypothetical protein [Caldalkalibacillus thermarum]|uniref:hypothetical protein n=1 Tax=Caldalkalibacillus thermarum TaxID=296745 RepID=UPI0016640470|nr:hypothetical protein [Caldalkalibacillus thermarum]